MRRFRAAIIAITIIDRSRIGNLQVRRCFDLSVAFWVVQTKRKIQLGNIRYNIDLFSAVHVSAKITERVFSLRCKHKRSTLEPQVNHETKYQRIFSTPFLEEMSKNIL